MTTQPSLSRKALLLLVVASGLALAACDREPAQRSAGQKLDDAVAATRANAEKASERVAAGATELKEDAKRAASEVGSAISDTTITAAVISRLAADKDLSLLRIDVGSLDGKVTLQGSAPDSGARERATTLAKAVQGVKSVDNRLVVKQS